MRAIVTVALAALLSTSASAAGWLPLFSSGGGGSFAYAETDAQSVTGIGFTNFTFSTVNFGAAAASRKIAVEFIGFCGGCGALSGFTIGGVSATSAVNNDTANYQNSIWYACVPSGATGSVAITGVLNVAAIVVYQITGESGGCSTAPSTTAKYSAAGAQPLSLAVTVPVGGVALVAAGSSGVSGTPTFAWTNTTAGAGDATTFQTTGSSIQQSGSHATSSATVTASSTQSMSFGGQVVSATWGP